jgi:TonB family protein
MRLTHLASFVLSPMLVVASAAASPVAPSPKTDAPVQVSQRVSTGVIAPQLLNTLNFRIPSDVVSTGAGGSSEVVLSLYVDNQGTPESVRVIRSFNPALDAKVVDAVLHSHFRPAELNHQFIPVEMSLTVSVKR